MASAVAVPSALNSAKRVRSAAMNSDSPTIPLQVIITAANTVSRASVEVSDASPETISVTISATSITVTATARTSDPKGSPTRCATTSAWCTAASTPAASSAPTTASRMPSGFDPHVAARSTTPSTGAAVVHLRLTEHHAPAAGPEVIRHAPAPPGRGAP